MLQADTLIESQILEWIQFSKWDSVKLNGEVENHIHPISIPTLNNNETVWNLKKNSCQIRSGDGFPYLEKTTIFLRVNC